MSILAALFLLVSAFGPRAANQIPVAAPMTTDLAGATQGTAYPSVFRIMPRNKGPGTGFLHRSGRVITAFHVVSGCSAQEITILNSSGQRIAVTNVLSDTNSDLALLMPAQPITASSFALATNENLRIGSQVSTWGYPGGYTGMVPLLGAGYLSGVQWDVLSNGVVRPSLVVNAAFNGGNSRGPLLDIESGQVIGVVVSKLAPLPREIEEGIEILKRETQGITWKVKSADGKEGSISEAQLVAKIVDYLRSQVQLVIGYAATCGNLKNFLRSQGIDP